MDQALIRALKARNIDVITVLDTQTEGQLDEEQLTLATSQKRVLYSHNIADFCRIHSKFIAQDKTHSGIALLSQEYSVLEPPKEVQKILLDLLEAKLSKPQGAWTMTEAVHTEIRGVFSQVLTQEDWQALA